MPSAMNWLLICVSIREPADFTAMPGVNPQPAVGLRRGRAQSHPGETEPPGVPAISRFSETICTMSVSFHRVGTSTKSTGLSGHRAHANEQAVQRIIDDRSCRECPGPMRRLSNAILKCRPSSSNVLGSADMPARAIL